MSSADDTLVITRLFDAPPEHVFNAWLTREEWQSWIGPEGVDCHVSLLESRIGGRYRIEMHLTGDTIVVTGVFKVIDRPRLLSFTWGAEGDPSRQSIVTVTFAERGHKTEMTLCQKGLGSTSNREQHARGWNSTLDKLGNYLTPKSHS